MYEQFDGTGGQFGDNPKARYIGALRGVQPQQGLGAMPSGPWGSGGSGLIQDPVGFAGGSGPPGGTVLPWAQNPPGPTPPTPPPPGDTSGPSSWGALSNAAGTLTGTPPTPPPADPTAGVPAPTPPTPPPMAPGNAAQIPAPPAPPADPMAQQAQYPTAQNAGVAPNVAGTNRGGDQGYLPSASQIASTQPLPFAAFGGIPYQQAATYNSASYNPAQIQLGGDTQTQVAHLDPAQQQSAALAHAAQQRGTAQAGFAQQQSVGVDPNSAQAYTNQYTGLLRQQMDPQFQRQDQALNESMAARGILNSGAAQQAQNDLYGQQSSAFAGAAAPIVSQGFGYQQADLSQNAAAQNAALGATAGYQQQSRLYNTGALNQTAAANTSYQQQANLANQSALNSMYVNNTGYAQQANLANAGYQQGANNANAALAGNRDFTNAQYANQAGQYNAGNAQQANQYNASAANAMNQYNANMYTGITSGDQTQYNNYLMSLYGSGNQYANGMMNNYLASYGTANNTALSTLGQGANNAYQAGQNAYNGAAGAWGGVGNAFTSAFKNGIGGKSGGGGTINDPANYPGSGSGAGEISAGGG